MKKQKRTCWPMLTKQKIVSVSFISAFFSLTVLTIFAQDPKIVFSENWDTATSANPWPYHSAGWWSYHNSVVSVAGHGKVLHSFFPEGTIGAGSGMGNYKIPLDSSYQEMYLSWDYYIPGDFDWGESDGITGGKFFGGLAGGKMPNIPHNSSDLTDGWASMFMFEAGIFHTYNYFKSSEFDPNGWPLGANISSTPKGVWKTVTIRVKVNNPNQSNGIFEVFVDSTLAYSETSVRYHNSVNTDYLIESIYLNLFWGGGDTARHVSPKDQYMRFDNLIAFYYLSGSNDYRSGASEQNRKINIPAAISYYPTPPNIFTETTYTEASGTIESHCGFYQPAASPGNFLTSTIEVEGASSIAIEVTKFDYDGGISQQWAQGLQTLKIYSGTSSGKTLERTFANGTYTTIPTTVNISGNSATIEWQAGSGNFNGFSLDYSSNGTGSGSNFECPDYFASQSGGQDSSKVLSVTIDGEGAVTPASGNYPSDITIVLTATPNTGWEFSGWSGDTTATANPLSVKMWKDKSITASFTDTTTSSSDTIAYWRFENNANDETGNHNGILYGSPDYYTSAAEGSYALNLDGSGRYANCGTITLGNSFSISGHCLIWGSSGIRALFGTTTSSSPDGILATVDLSTGVFSLITGDGSSSATATSTSGNFSSGTWVKFEYIVDRTTNTCTIKVDDLDVSSSTAIEGDFTDGKTFYIGQDSGGGNRIWGRVDGVLIKGVGSNPPSVTYALSTSVTGSGSVNPDSGTYPADTTVMITATANTGWEFTGWSGDTTATINPLPLYMWKNMSITAAFDSITSESDTIAFWKFDNNANDQTGNHDATLYGNPGYYTPAAEGSYALNLDGSGRYANCGTITLGNSFSISGHCLIWGSSGIRTLFGTTTSSSPDGILATVDLSTGVFSLITGDGSSSATATSTSGNFSSGTWVKFEYIVDRTTNTCTIKVDDLDVSSSTTIVGDFTDGKTFYIGQDSGGGNRIWGRVDGMLIRSSGLKKAQINAPSAEKPDTEIKYYPVPVTDYLKLENIPERSIITVFNIRGAKVLVQENGDQSKLKIDMQRLNAGIYFCKIHTISSAIEEFMIVKNQ